MNDQDANEAAIEIEGMTRELLEGFCLHPEHLALMVSAYPGVVVVRIRAHAADTPRIIGDGGNQFRALYMIAQEYGKRHKVRVVFSNVEQPVVGDEESYPRFENDPAWPREELLRQIDRIVDRVFRFPEVIRIEHQDVSDEETHVQVHVSQRETKEKMERTDWALASLFNAIGRRHGRILTVMVVADVPDDGGEQPARADGRHVREVKR